MHHLIGIIDLLGAVPDPGRGVAPPGAAKLEKLLQWAAWIGYALAVLGVIVSAWGMALQHRSGGGMGGESGARLGYVLAGSLLIGSASTLIQAMS